jgi:hypothetical protein
MSEEELCKKLGAVKIITPQQNKGYMFAVFENEEARNQAYESHMKDATPDSTFKLSKAFIRKPGYKKRGEKKPDDMME